MQAIEVGGLFNVRASKAHAPWLVRSGAAEDITAEGADTLQALGLTVVLDLREPCEVGVVAHGVPVRSVQLYGAAPPRTGRLEEIYEFLLRERGEALTRAVSVIADATGGVLVHCTAGKDRTGLVVALASRAAGVAPADVIADYARSGSQIREVREAYALEVAGDVPAVDRADILRLHLDSPPEAMQHALLVLEQLGGPETYLLAHGMDGNQLAALRRKHTGCA